MSEAKIYDIVAMATVDELIHALLYKCNGPEGILETLESNNEYQEWSHRELDGLGPPAWVEAVEDRNCEDDR